MRKTVSSWESRVYMPTAFSVSSGTRKRERYLSHTCCRTASKVDGSLLYGREKCYRVPGRSQWKHQTVSDWTEKTRALQAWEWIWSWFSPLWMKIMTCSTPEGLSPQHRKILPPRKILRMINSQCRVKPYLWLGGKTSQSLLTSAKTLRVSLSTSELAAFLCFPGFIRCSFSQDLFFPSCCPLLLTVSWKSNSRIFSYFIMGGSFACCDPITKYL